MAWVECSVHEGVPVAARQGVSTHLEALVGVVVAVSWSGVVEIAFDKGLVALAYSSAIG